MRSRQREKEREICHYYEHLRVIFLVIEIYVYPGPPSITSIAEYLATSRHTVYDTLKRWTEEGVAGLEAKSKARKRPRKATLSVRNEIRKLQENPLLDEFRVHTALLRIGIKVSPATCGRIMAANRQLYGIEKPKQTPSRIVDPMPCCVYW